MGSLQAAAYAALIDDGVLDLEGAIRCHLRSNCYPPVPDDLVPACLEALGACNAEDYDREITLPEGRCRETVPAREIVKRLHLEAFLDGGG
jgi:hypothetical protein